MRLLQHTTVLLFLLLPSIILLTHGRSSVMCNAATAADDPDDDIVDDDMEEDDDATIETDEDVVGGTESSLTGQDVEDEEEEEEEFLQLQPSADAETNILFVKPNDPQELPAGQLVKVIVGFANHGTGDFIVNYLESSFRYPQDYSFHIQNFSLIEYQRVIEPGRQASFAYNFMPSETFSSRPFGLVVNLNYNDNEGNFYQDAVFNQTIQVVETEEGLDGETFFLYVFLAAVFVLLLVAGQQFLATVGKKKLSGVVGGVGGGGGLGGGKSGVEVGTVSGGDVDYDWIPKEALNDINKSPKSVKTSPRNRRTKRSEAD